jgi:hypothetical protein
VIVERYNSARGAGRLEEFFTRVPSTSKAGITYNRGKKQRAEIRRWAQRNGHDLTGQRSIPPTVPRLRRGAGRRSRDGAGPDRRRQPGHP